MEEVINHLVENAKKQPALADLARVAAMSSSHFQRTFQEWTGLSPKQFLQVVSRHHSRALLPERSIAESAAELGYSSESRLYDNFVRFESVTPGEFKSAGNGILVSYGFGMSPFGETLVAWTERGIVKLVFLHLELDGKKAVEELKQEWPNASYSHSDIEAETRCAHIFNRSVEGQNSMAPIEKAPLRLWVKGSVFQVKVWEALLAIPEGATWSYQELASYIGVNNSVRAVASAVARNPVGYIIPCHRVIRASGAINQYRWGSERKAAMLISECAKSRKV